MAPQEVRSSSGPGQPTEEVDVSKSSAPAHPPSEDHDQDERPHACNDGWVTIGQIVIDPETGEETEEFALYLCRKCAERS
jgi:hypothetical protein